MELNVSDIIQIVGIIVALIVGMFSIVISVITLRQNSKIIKESNMAQIVIFPVKLYGDIVPRIKIQNFGMSTGIITDIKTIPEIPEDDIIINPFRFYSNLPIAPKQSFMTVFSKESRADVPIEEFDVIITYETLGEEVVSKCHINYGFVEATFETNSPSQDINKALDKINQSIQGLQ